jgi:hypothetical protein
MCIFVYKYTHQTKFISDLRKVLDRRTAGSTPVTQSLQNQYRV